MKSIILMRHGKPRLAPSGWIAPAGMEKWIADYNLSEVEADGIPAASLALAESVHCIVASTAPRALSSVRALGRSPTISDALFCEAPLPFAAWNFPWLPAQAWTALFRVLWLFGYSRRAASLKETRLRAGAAARRLITMAEQEGTVLLMGHGIMNRLIAKELATLGWSAANRQGSRYWSACALRPLPSSLANSILSR